MATKQEQDVVDRVKNGDNEKFNQKLDGSETLPLTRNKQKTDDELTDPESGKTRRGRLSFDALMQLPRKRRILYILTASLCAVLLVIIILMIAFWPEVPFYLKADLCVDKECVVASQQLLLWSNTTYKPCRDTYQWACGNFRKEYEEGDYFVIKKGEWDYQTYNEYEELRDLNRFISMLPASSQSYSAESMISGLYKSCREIDALDKSQSDMLLRQAIKSVDGWQALRDGNRLQFWEYRKALVYVQAHHGVFPYFKMSVENRYSDPYDYIITLDAGEVGLPDEYFYNADNNDEVIVAYKMLLRDFAINMGVVTQEAELFADEIFHYEKRIVNNILSVQTPNERHINEIKTIQEIKTIAPSLPIFESLQAILPQIKITDETEILVRDVDVLREMSIVVSTSDKKPLNNFIIWSLARKLLPHLSKEYRILTENFNNAIYGRSARYPRWMVCTKIVREWLPFSVDALRENPDLLRTGDSQLNFIRERPNTFPNKTYGNDEFLKLMFHTLRHQVQTSIEEANWIERSLKDFIIEKLASTRLQIGIPSEILQTKSYIDEYYKGLMLYNLYFAEHLESIWSFRKLRMQDKLKSQNIIDMIILEMYAANEVKLISYSTTLNMVLISKQLTQSNYFDYRFPIPINFARVGADIVEVLVESISTFEKQHKWVSKSLTNSHADTVFKIDPSCLADEVANVDLSDSAMSSYTTTMSAARIAAKALTKFIESVDGTVPVIGASIDPSLTYENLQLTNRRRLPGLRRLNENELFTLAYMQKHCSTPIADKDYARIKPHVEKKLAEMYLFKATWRHIQFLPQSTDCSVKDVTCTNVL